VYAGLRRHPDTNPDAPARFRVFLRQACAGRPGTTGIMASLSTDEKDLP